MPSIDPSSPMTIAVAAVLVLVVAGVLWLLWVRAADGRAKKRIAAAAKDEAEFKNRVKDERALAVVVERFEKLLASAPAPEEALARLAELTPEARRRLSSEGANQVGFILAKAGKATDALRWLDESLNRDDSYFRTLNNTLKSTVFGSRPSSAAFPTYPFKHVTWPGLAARTKVKARVYHDLGRHAEVEAELGKYADAPDIRFMRAEFRRLRGSNAEALADYKEVLLADPDNDAARGWIAVLTGQPVPPKRQQVQAPTPAAARARSGPPARQPAAQQQPQDGRPDPRVVLGVPESANVDQILAAYLALCRKFHPDLLTEKGAEERAAAEEKMREINYAWKQLSKDS